MAIEDALKDYICGSDKPQDKIRVLDEDFLLFKSIVEKYMDEPIDGKYPYYAVYYTMHENKDIVWLRGDYYGQGRTKRFNSSDFLENTDKNTSKKVENNKIENKKEKKTMENTTKNFNNETINKGLETLKSTIEKLIVDDKNIGLTPSGLSIKNRVYSKKEKALLRVGGTQLLSIPVGFRLPTEAKEVEYGDIIFDNNEPLFVLKKESVDGYQKVTAIDTNDREILIPATLDLLGKQTFEKLVTPFQYDGGCNPLLNIGVLSGLSYLNGGLENAIEKLTPQMLSLIPKLNLSEYLKDKRVAFLAPAIIIGLKMFKDNNLDFSNITSFKEVLKEKLSAMDKKTLGIILLAILLLIYVAKDKIAEKLLEEKIRNIRLVGKFAEPTAKFLIKIPSIKKRIKL